MDHTNLTLKIGTGSRSQLSGRAPRTWPERGASWSRRLHAKSPPSKARLCQAMAADATWQSPKWYCLNPLCKWNHVESCWIHVEIKLSSCWVHVEFKSKCWMGRSIGEMLALCLRLWGSGSMVTEVWVESWRFARSHCVLRRRIARWFLGHGVCNWCCAVSVAVSGKKGQKVLNRIKQDRKWCQCFLPISLLNLAPAPMHQSWWRKSKKDKKGLKAAWGAELGQICASVGILKCNSWAFLGSACARSQVDKAEQRSKLVKIHHSTETVCVCIM